MKLKEINNEIVEASNVDSGQFLRTFLKHEENIVDQLNNFEGLKSEIYLHHDAGELDQIKFAIIFSDFVSIYTAASSINNYHITNFTDSRSEFYIPNMQITIPASLRNEIDHINDTLIPGYAHPNDEDIKKATKDFLPLLQAERSVIRPVRTVWVDHQKRTGENQGVIYYAHGNTSKHHWTIRDSFSDDSLPIHNYLRPDQVKTVFSLTLPYFKNTQLDRLNQIISEEKDLLSPLRKELKNIVKNFDEKETSIEEIRQDILRPQMDKINRHFKNYKNGHRWKVSGNAALFSLSLLKVFVPTAAIAEFVSSIFAGKGFSGIILSERDYQAKLNQLRDNPYFLLWRINKLPKM